MSTKAKPLIGAAESYVPIRPFRLPDERRGRLAACGWSEASIKAVEARVAEALAVFGVQQPTPGQMVVALDRVARDVVALNGALADLGAAAAKLQGNLECLDWHTRQALDLAADLVDPGPDATQQLQYNLALIVVSIARLKKARPPGRPPIRPRTGLQVQIAVIAGQEMAKEGRKPNKSPTAPAGVAVREILDELGLGRDEVRNYLRDAEPHW